MILEVNLIALYATDGTFLAAADADDPRDPHRHDYWTARGFSEPFHLCELTEVPVRAASKLVAQGTQRQAYTPEEATQVAAKYRRIRTRDAA